MKKGFSIRCLECNSEVIITKDYSREKDESEITFSVLGSYPFQSLYLVCSKCENHDIETEV